MEREEKERTTSKMGDEEVPTYEWAGGESTTYVSDSHVEAGTTCKVKYPSGDVFEGTFTLDKEKEEGTYTMSIPGEDDEEGNPTFQYSVYSGAFSKNLRSGAGTQTYPNGEK